MNLIHIAGHLGADPEVRFTSSGKKVTTLRIAARVRRKNEDDTIWWRVSVWGETYDKMIQYLKKGSSVVVIGELQKPEIFNDREGKPQVSMNINALHVMFSPFGKSDNQKSDFQPQHQPISASSSLENAFDSANQPAGAMPMQTESQAFPGDDEVPF